MYLSDGYFPRIKNTDTFNINSINEKLFSQRTSENKIFGKLNTVGYIIFLLGIYLLISIIIFKIKYSFWMSQPVFHFYNLRYRCFKKGIITTQVPSINKYFNGNIKFTDFEELDVNDIVNIHYLLLNSHKNEFNIIEMENKNEFKDPNNDTTIVVNKKYDVKKETMCDLYINNYCKSYISMVYNDDILFSVICSKGVHFKFHNKKFNGILFDKMCIKSSLMENNKKLNTKIMHDNIFTHYYHQTRIKNNHGSNCVYMIKNIGDQNIIQPAIVYYEYTYDTTYWNKKYSIEKPYIKIVTINDGNYKLFSDFFNKIQGSFKHILCYNIMHFKQLCMTGHYYIMILTIHDKPCGFYVFKNEFVKYNNKVNIKCICSFNTVGKDLFILGFFNALKDLNNKIKFQYLSMENVLNNDTIIQNIEKKYPHVNMETISYLFYNYATHGVYSNEILKLI